MIKQNQQTSKTYYSYYPPKGADLLGEFEQNHRSYQLFKELGLDRDFIGLDRSGNKQTTVNRILDDGLFRRLRPFLLQVDLAKGPIQRRVIKLERRKDKGNEYLVTNTEWVAKDYLGNELVSTLVKEGMYNEPVTQTVMVKGKTVRQYSNWKPVYDIPFSVEAVDKTLEDQINDMDSIKFMVRTSQSERDDSYSLEQFRDSTFVECIDIHKQGKGLNR